MNKLKKNCLFFCFVVVDLTVYSYLHMSRPLFILNILIKSQDFLETVSPPRL